MSGQREGSLRAWVLLHGRASRLRLSCSQQASFLITSALRFMLNAPGVTSWQYTLLQLQVMTVLSSPCCSLPSCSLTLPPSLQPKGPLGFSLGAPAALPPFLPPDSCPFPLREWPQGGEARLALPASFPPSQCGSLFPRSMASCPSSPCSFQSSGFWRPPVEKPESWRR